MLTDKIHNKYFYLGNKEIIEEYKVGFLCSRKVPAKKILKIYDWAIEQREKGICVVSGFHSKIERDVFHYLSKGKQPMVLVLARGLLSKWPKKISNLIEQEQLLVITAFDKSIRRVTKETAQKRNEIIMKLSNELFVGHIDPYGKLANLINTGLHTTSIKTIG